MRFDQGLRRRLVEHLGQFEVHQVDVHQLDVHQVDGQQVDTQERRVAERLRRAAVGVVVVADEHGRACFVLTRRVSTLRRHAGQWALPGGRVEGGESVEEAALREILEEVGLEVGPEAVIGRLDDFVSRSGHLISPLVFWAQHVGQVRANPEEVDAAYLVPLDELEHVRLHPLLHFAMPSVPTTVHAPTAAILYQFREVALHGREVRVIDVEQPRFAWS